MSQVACSSPSWMESEPTLSPSSSLAHAQPGSGALPEDLEAVDLEVLEAVVARSYGAITAQTHTYRAGEAGIPELHE